MSHFTKVTTEIRDLETLKKALSKMNLKLEKNTECRYYYGIENRENVIKLPGPYDVAIEYKEDGTYNLDADFFGGFVEIIIGSKGDKLLRYYAIEKLKNEAKRKGYKVFEKSESTVKIIDSKTAGKVEVEFLPDGKIEIKTSGFKGKSCMKFTEIEKALGNIESTKKTPEYYQSDATKIQIEEWS